MAVSAPTHGNKKPDRRINWFGLAKRYMSFFNVPGNRPRGFSQVLRFFPVDSLLAHLDVNASAP